MANKIRGVTVEIGGDTSGLNKALDNTNKQIKSTQSQLRDVEKLLKLDPSNTELLEQKQKLLGDRVTETTEKLKTLEEAEAQLKEAGVDENSEQFMALQREILSTREYLKDATEDAEKFNVKLEQTKVKFQNVSDKAGEVAEKTKGLSAVAGGVVAGLTGMAVKAMKASDDLNTLANQSGFTTEELQKFEYASEMVDVSTDTIVGSIKKLRKNMDSDSKATNEAWQRLGISVTDTNGEMRDSTEVFYETVQALSQVANETERDQLAMQLFGKSADQLAGIIDDGGEALRMYGEQAEETGKIWSQESIDASNAINDIVDTLKADVSQTILITGAKALEALQPIIETVAEKISGLLEWVGKADEDTLKIILTIGAVVASISPIAFIVSKITGALNGVLSLAPAISKGFSAVTTFAQANPILLIATAVAGLTALVIANWDKIKPILDAIWQKVKDIFDNIKNKVKSVFETIKGFFKTYINGYIKVLNLLIAGINLLIAGLNKISFDVPEWVPIFGGKKWGFDIKALNQIPLLANGGVVTSGQAIVGEKGAELLTVGNGKATVQPLTNNSYTTINQTSTRPIQVVLQLDKQVLAKQMFTPNQSEGIRRGGSLVGAK